MSLTSPTPSVRCVIFDFNGVIVDDEPLHCQAFAETLSEKNLLLTEQEYFNHFLGIEDRLWFQTFFDHKKIPITSSELDRLVEIKAVRYMALLKDRLKQDPLLLFPGVFSLIRGFQEKIKIPLAINSGALRSEIDLILQKAGLTDDFVIIVSADEVEKGKPHPEGYLLAYKKIREIFSGYSDLRPDECLVLEDAPVGIKAAKAAGMTCIAVAHYRPTEQLAEADRVLSDLIGICPTTLLVR